jgi:hypothetical protein
MADFIKLYYKIVSIIKSLVKSLWRVDAGVIEITSLFTLFSGFSSFNRLKIIIELI